MTTSEAATIREWLTAPFSHFNVVDLTGSSSLYLHPSAWPPATEGQSKASSVASAVKRKRLPEPQPQLEEEITIKKEKKEDAENVLGFDRSLRFLQLCNKRLSNQECSMSDDSNLDLLNDIPAVLSQLTSISIDDDNEDVNNEMLTTMGKYCGELSSLVLQNCCEIRGDWNVTSRQPQFSKRFDGLCKLFEGCKKLKSISARYSVTQAIVETLATVSTQLESITVLLFCDTVSSDALHRMFEQQPQLKKFNAEGFGYGASKSFSLQKLLSCIVSNCPSFEELRVDGIDDEVGWNPTPALKVIHPSLQIKNLPPNSFTL